MKHRAYICKKKKKKNEESAKISNIKASYASRKRVIGIIYKDVIKIKEN